MGEDFPRLVIGLGLVVALGLCLMVPNSSARAMASNAQSSRPVQEPGDSSRGNESPAERTCCYQFEQVNLKQHFVGNQPGVVEPAEFGSSPVVGIPVDRFLTRGSSTTNSAFVVQVTSHLKCPRSNPINAPPVG